MNPADQSDPQMRPELRAVIDRIDLINALLRAGREHPELRLTQILNMVVGNGSAALLNAPDGELAARITSVLDGTVSPVAYADKTYREAHKLVNEITTYAFQRGWRGAAMDNADLRKFALRITGSGNDEVSK